MGCLKAAMVGLFFGTAVAPLAAQQRFSFAHRQMGTEFHLVFYAQTDSSQARQIAESVFRYVDTLNYIFSDYIPDSDLSLLSNQAGTGKKVPVKPELYAILVQSRHFSRASGGAFDVTVGALSKLWRRAKYLKTPPDSSQIQAAVATVDYRSVRLYRRGHQVRLSKPGTRLDLGGIAQGYAADRCLEKLRQHGITQALADAGGDIALGDAPPNTPGWAIQRPMVDTAGVTTYETLWLSRCGITTSGATFRYFEHNGVRYSHIIDPRTGNALTHGHLVTVKAPNATTADAWATAISVLGREQWQRLKPVPGMEVWVEQR